MDLSKIIRTKNKITYIDLPWNKGRRIILGREETAIGAVYGLAFWPFLGLYSLLIALISGSLWSIGGAAKTSTGIRKVGVPIVIGLSVLIAQWHWQYILCSVAAFGVLTMGYGMPSHDDEGSILGNVFWFIFKNEHRASIILRGFLGLLFGVCYFPLAQVSIVGYGLLLLGISIGAGAAFHFVDGEFHVTY